MRNTFIGRVVPTWKLGEKETLRWASRRPWGRSTISRRLLSIRPIRSLRAPGTRPLSGWAVDGTWSNGPWKVFAEASQRYGVLTPCDYISGGPSNRYTDAIAGITYTRGPVEYRCVYSYGNRIKGSGVFVLDRTGDKRWFSGHATTIALPAEDTRSTC